MGAVLACQADPDSFQFCSARSSTESHASIAHHGFRTAALSRADGAGGGLWQLSDHI